MTTFRPAHHIDNASPQAFAARLCKWYPSARVVVYGPSVKITVGSFARSWTRKAAGYWQEDNGGGVMESWDDLRRRAEQLMSMA